MSENNNNPLLNSESAKDYIVFVMVIGVFFSYFPTACSLEERQLFR